MIGRLFWSFGEPKRDGVSSSENLYFFCLQRLHAIVNGMNMYGIWWETTLVANSCVSESITDVISRNREKRKSSFIARSKSFLPRTERNGKPSLHDFEEFVTMDSNSRGSKRRETSMTISLASAQASNFTDDEPDEQIARISVVQKRLQCSACSKTFVRTNHLRRHARLTKDEFHRALWLVLNRKRCPKCRQLFTTSADLKNHKKRSLCSLRTFKNAFIPQEEFIESKLKKVIWKNDRLNVQDRKSEEAQQSFASNSNCIQEKTKGKTLCATAHSWEGQGQSLLANTISWATENWSDTTYLHLLKEQDYFTTTSINSLVIDHWDNATYSFTTANTIPWPTRDWVSETYSRSSEERYEFTTANTVPWSTKDWNNAMYQFITAATISWPRKDWDFKADVYLLEEQNLNNVVITFPLWIRFLEQYKTATDIRRAVDQK